MQEPQEPQEPYESYISNDREYRAKPDSNGCTGCFFKAAPDSDKDCNCSTELMREHNCVENSIIWMKYSEPTKQETSKQGKKFDQQKERYDLIPVLGLEEIAKVLTAGANKYNEDYNEENWRVVQNPKRRYFSAAMRHMQAVRKGNKQDDETGLHHYAHAITNLMFLLEADLEQESKGEQW